MTKPTRRRDAARWHSPAERNGEERESDPTRTPLVPERHHEQRHRDEGSEKPTQRPTATHCTRLRSAPVASRAPITNAIAAAMKNTTVSMRPSACNANGGDVSPMKAEGERGRDGDQAEHRIRKVGAFEPTAQPARAGPREGRAQSQRRPSDADLCHAREDEQRRGEPDRIERSAGLEEHRRPEEEHDQQSRDLVVGGGSRRSIRRKRAPTAIVHTRRTTAAAARSAPSWRRSVAARRPPPSPSSRNDRLGVPARSGTDFAGDGSVRRTRVADVERSFRSPSDR